LDEAIATALTRADLSVEQRVRLARVAAWRFRSTPMGGLGVSFGPSGEGAVQINNVVPGFPASDLLRPQDVILAVDDRVVAGQDHLRAEILGRAPGDTLPVLIRRGRTILDLALPLGAYNDLEGAAMLDEATVRAAMRVRGGVDAPATETVGSATTSAEWVEAAFPGDRVGTPVLPGDRRGPGISAARTGHDHRQIPRTRGSWSTRAEAEQAVGDQRRSDLGLRMTSGVRYRSVLVEFQQALESQIRASAESGENADALSERLAGVAERLARLDATLLELARTLDTDADRRP
jgi:hypothetical protein